MWGERVRETDFEPGLRPRRCFSKMHLLCTHSLSKKRKQRKRGTGSQEHMVEKCSTHLNEELSSLKTYLFRPAMEIFASSFRRTILSHMTTSLRIYSIKQILVNHSVYSDRRSWGGGIERKYRTPLCTTVLRQ